MAKYSITHSCGHASDAVLFGPHGDRDRKIAWLEGQICDGCLQSERIKVAQHMSEADEALGLPKLSGSEKQCTWATQIRHEALLAAAKMERRLKEAIMASGPEMTMEEQLLFELDEYTATWKTQAYAHWWIENKETVSEDGLASHMRKLMHELGDAVKSLKADGVALSIGDKTEIIKMALARREEMLEERRKTAQAERDAAAKQKAEAEATAQQKLAVERAKAWEARDQIAAAVVAALGASANGASLNVWMPAAEKRVYLESCGRKACLYVTGSGRNRPGKLESNFKCEDSLLRAALELAAAKYKTLRMVVSADGKAR